jgi:hypothetical protein
MTVSTADDIAVRAAHQQGREDERRDLLLWLDVVVQFQLHQHGDVAGARLLQRVAQRLEQCEHLGGA